MACIFKLTLVGFMMIPATLVGGEPTVPEHFKALSPLVGKTWVGSFPGGASDTQKFEWLYNGKFLRNTHWVKNAGGDVVYEGETVFAWDHKKKTVVWWYWNTTGGHMTGTLWEEDGAYMFEGENNAPDGQTAKARGAYLIGKDSWTSVQYFWKDGAWQKQGEVVFKTVDPSGG